MMNPASMAVVVNVYDLHDSNRMLHNVGTGFYHTGIEVNGYEYSFSQNGVVRTRPRLPEFGALREQLQMGYYDGGMGGVNSIISALRNERFQPGAYDVVHLNCNHFSDAFCSRAVGAHLPEWINRMASVGSSFVQSQHGNDKPPNGDGEFPALGQVKDPVLNVSKVGSNSNIAKTPVTPTQKPGNDSVASSVFSWFGWGASTADTSTSAPSSDSTKPITSSAGKKRDSSTAKKELTDKQKEMLAKMKQKCNS